MKRGSHVTLRVSTVYILPLPDNEESQRHGAVIKGQGYLQQLMGYPEDTSSHVPRATPHHSTSKFQISHQITDVTITPNEYPSTLKATLKLHVSVPTVHKHTARGSSELTYSPDRDYF